MKKLSLLVLVKLYVSRMDSIKPLSGVPEPECYHASSGSIGGTIVWEMGILDLYYLVLVLCPRVLDPVLGRNTINAAIFVQVFFFTAFCLSNRLRPQYSANVALAEKDAQ